MHVRDLFLQKDLGTFTGNFTTFVDASGGVVMIRLKKATAAPATARLERASSTEAVGGDVSVFTSGQEGYPSYRIPSILSMDNGDVLVFAEGRFGGDHGHNDIVMKRSTDSGKTWASVQKVYGESNSTHSVTIGNPSPIALHTTPGHIVMVACRENNEVLTLSSTDYGHTWSNATYVTEQVKLKNWTWVATGPPQGLQLESGRLFIAADHYAGKGADWGSHSMYSDDLGQSWHISASIDGDGWVHTLACTHSHAYTQLSHTLTALSYTHSFSAAGVTNARQRGHQTVRS
jgi:hypothetical protein